jgi:hypothetical protein
LDSLFCCLETGLRQLQVNSILSSLNELRRSSLIDAQNPFCVVGITMEDLFDTRSDLFVAGMAAGADKV